ncbi:pyroglutamyl-peptidase I [Tepidamorphus sp. 3E244]|uniref:pyroglutamyl-peptidase I family protein n=1 Tax=Tepidamorphus sp. 3E244 TaxID=3385498 RepID=UPI0038FCD631
MAAHPRLLVTGFGAFPGAPTNPTEAMVDELDRRAWPKLRGVDLIAHVLPVEYALLEHWHEALDVVRPDAILHYGLAASAQTVRIETIARNNAAPYRPDAAGRGTQRAIMPRERQVLRASVPVDRLVEAVRPTGLFVRKSQDAGDYLCNAILFSSLSWSLRNRGSVAGFVHVPSLPAETLQPVADACVAEMCAWLARRTTR